MAGLSLVAILITSVVTIFLLMNTSFNNSEKAINLNKQLPGLVNKMNTTDNISEIDMSLDKRASFVIFTNGTLRNFSNSMYHNLSTDVYIESIMPYVIHVKNSGITYDDFFKTLPLKLTSQCLITGTGQTFCNEENKSLKFYLNGENVDDLLEKEIQNKDKVLISFGPIEDGDIKSQLNQIPNP